ncbi:MAG: hypothetical protein Q8N44_04310 [Rubrivivax sp.]|nr:hypothetical protein [Rubrivivax sp.]MDP3082902.1 hypothetical protein [Rubrivivax sp.]
MTNDTDQGTYARLSALTCAEPGAAPMATPEGRNPQKRVQVSPDGRDLLITSFDTGEIAIAAVDELRRPTKIAVEKGPMGISFGATGLAYVMNHDQGTVSVIDLPGRRVERSFATARGPETLAAY